MIVTKFNYPIELRLIKKIDLMIQRCIQKNPKRDAVLLIEGAEGEGKTSMSIGLGYYIAEQTGRKFNHTRLFFDVEKMMKFGQETDEEIIIWDEPSAQAMSGDSGKKIVRNLYRFLNMCRFKRHFIIINMSYFNLFKDYIVWQRPLGMIHVYSRDEKIPGRFVYIKKKSLEKLWMDWHRKKQRNYKKYCSKNIRGNFPDILNPEYKNNVLSDFDFDAYEEEKLKATMDIGKEETRKKIDVKIMALQYSISRLPERTGIATKTLTKLLGIGEKSLRDWRLIIDKYPSVRDYLADKGNLSKEIKIKWRANRQLIIKGNSNLKENDKETDKETAETF